jgi:hypothetical protein
MAAQEQQEAVNIMTLGPQQLNMLREQLSQEVDDLAENHTMLGRLALRSSNAARAVETLGEAKKGALGGCCSGAAVHSVNRHMQSCAAANVLSMILGAELTSSNTSMGWTATDWFLSSAVAISINAC